MEEQSDERGPPCSCLVGKTATDTQNPEHEGDLVQLINTDLEYEVTVFSLGWCSKLVVADEKRRLLAKVMEGQAEIM